jgi:hypothetical protein
MQQLENDYLLDHEQMEINNKFEMLIIIIN